MLTVVDCLVMFLCPSPLSLFQSSLFVQTNKERIQANRLFAKSTKKTSKKFFLAKIPAFFLQKKKKRQKRKKERKERKERKEKEEDFFRNG